MPMSKPTVVKKKLAENCVRLIEGNFFHSMRDRRLALKWDSKYSVGVEIVDKQHMKLVNLINKIETYSEMEELNIKAISQVIQELLEYTEIHFRQEEEVMKRHAYVGLERHKKLHESFIGKVKLFEAKFTKGPRQVLDIMLPFLVKWLEHHILIEDKKYSVNVGEKFKL